MKKVYIAHGEDMATLAQFVQDCLDNIQADYTFTDMIIHDIVTTRDGYAVMIEFSVVGQI